MRALITSILILVSCQLHASPSSIRQKLHHVKQQITTTQQQLKNKKAAQKKSLHQLQATEIKISDISKKLTALDSELTQLRESLTLLHEKQAATKKNIQTQLAIFADELRSEYMIHPESKLKLLLNQQDTNLIGRYLTYARYLNEHQQHNLSHLRTLQADLSDTEKALSNQNAELQARKAQQEQQRTLLNAQLKQRQQVLAKLHQQIHSKQAILAELAANRVQFEKTLKKLKHLSKDNATYFISHKGQLPWPIHGNIITEFDSHIAKSNMRMNATVISAKEGTSVHAIAPGKVVFADWMAGYGLVVIVDHGKHYLTIYGRNSALIKKVGDTIAANDVIAKVGSSGGYQQAALYFSLRHNAKALNPRTWCVKKDNFKRI